MNKLLLAALLLTSFNAAADVDSYCTEYGLTAGAMMGAWQRGVPEATLNQWAKDNGDKGGFTTNQLRTLIADVTGTTQYENPKFQQNRINEFTNSQEQSCQLDWKLNLIKNKMGSL